MKNIKEKDFIFLILVGLWLSNIGTFMFIFISTWEITQFGNNYLTLFLITTTLPLSILHLLAGTIADKMNKIKVIFFADLMCFFILLLFFPFIDMLYSPILIMTLNVLIVMINLPYMPALISFVGKYMEKESREKYNSHIFISNNISSIIGASLTGIIITVFSYKYVVLINLITFGIGFTLTGLFCLKYKWVLKESSSLLKVKVKESLFMVAKESKNSILFIKENRNLFLFIMFIPLVSGVQNLFPKIMPLAGIEYHLGPQLYSNTMIILGISILLGNLLSKQKFIKKISEKILSMNFFIQGMALLMLTIFFPNKLVLFTGVLVMGTLSGIVQVAMASYIQHNAPREIVGTVFASIGSLSRLIHPIMPMILLLSLTSKGYLYILSFIVLISGLFIIISITKENRKEAENADLDIL